MISDNQKPNSRCRVSVWSHDEKVTWWILILDDDISRPGSLCVFLLLFENGGDGQVSPRDAGANVSDAQRKSSRLVFHALQIQSFDVIGQWVLLPIMDLGRFAWHAWHKDAWNIHLYIPFHSASNFFTSHTSQATLSGWQWKTSQSLLGIFSAYHGKSNPAWEL